MAPGVHRRSTLLRYLLLLLFKYASSSSSIVKTLPGFDGDLPFKLETGYIGVGKNDEFQLFYYFVESEREPEEDPLVLSLTGGPGCSANYALTFEIGPITYDPSTFGSSLPSLILNPYSWTKISNVIFIDQPVYTGFSYVNNSDGYIPSDTETVKHIYDFLVKWLDEHPKFKKSSLYIQGESYAGKLVPLVTWEIVKANEAGLLPQLPLKVKGYMSANPATCEVSEFLNDRVPYAHSMGLISDKYMMLAEQSCNGNYVNPDTDDVRCYQTLESINECLSDIYGYHILEPDCYDKKYIALNDGGQLFSQHKQPNIILPSQGLEIDCRTTYYKISDSWANNPRVREALHVREGTIKEWIRCNRTLQAVYIKDVPSSVDIHRLLSKKGYKGLVYSGDHDMMVPYTSTLKWILSLNLTLDDDWRPWKVKRQVGGYTMRFQENGTYLTFATVKGAGHTPPEYKPEECFNMVSRWLSNEPL